MAASPVGAPVEILTRSQPYTNHDGGDMAFGPDGYPISASATAAAATIPEGFGAAPRHGARQDDPHRRRRAAPYTIPKTNPFASSTGAEKKEISRGGSATRGAGASIVQPAIQVSATWPVDVGRSTRSSSAANLVDHVRGFPQARRQQNLCDTPGLRDPIVEHPRSEASRSPAATWPLREGDLAHRRLRYGDFVSGNVAIPDGEGQADAHPHRDQDGNLAAFTLRTRTASFTRCSSARSEARALPPRLRPRPSPTSSPRPDAPILRIPHARAPG